jgi:hypothetical protein
MVDQLSKPSHARLRNDKGGTMTKHAKGILLALAVVAIPSIGVKMALGSDHADTPELAANPGQDISDVFMFPSPTNSQNVVLAMDVHPLIGTGQGTSTFFDPNVLYQFKIDNTGDGVEDLVIQVKANGNTGAQIFSVSGPIKPSITGTVSTIELADSVVGHYNQAFTTGNGMKVFCGPREDPFFFDLDQFFKIFPDRATPISGKPVSNPDAPQAVSWRPAGQAQDFLSAHQFNVLSIVVEVPRSLLVSRSTKR